MSADNSHSGPVQVQFTDTHCVVLCPLGHIVTSRRLDHTWAGSDVAARVSWHQNGAERHRWVVTCYGALPTTKERT